jgi:hypothetical protein
MALAESIFAELSAAADVTAVIASGGVVRLLPGLAPAGTAAPYVVYNELPPSPNLTLNEASTSGTRIVQLSCVADNYQAARDLAAKIMDALDNQTLAGGERCLSVADFDGFSQATDHFLRIVEADFFSAPAT